MYYRKMIKRASVCICTVALVKNVQTQRIDKYERTIFLRDRVLFIEVNNEHTSSFYALRTRQKCLFYSNMLFNIY